MLEQKDTLRQILRWGLSAVLPRKWFLTHGPRSSATVCLTFDDGPDPVHTPRLLDALAAASVQATFFVIGERAQRHPAIVRRIVAEGHALGHHSFFHREPAHTSTAALIEEVRKSRALLREITGSESTLFRPPHGKVTAGKLVALLREGQSVVLWNVDPKDFQARDAAQVLASLTATPLRGGDIVLLHDTSPYAAAIMPELARSLGEQASDGVQCLPGSEPGADLLGCSSWAGASWPRTLSWGGLHSLEWEFYFRTLITTAPANGGARAQAPVPRSRSFGVSPARPVVRTLDPVKEVKRVGVKSREIGGLLFEVLQAEVLFVISHLFEPHEPEVVHEPRFDTLDSRTVSQGLKEDADAAGLQDPSNLFETDLQSDVMKNAQAMDHIEGVAREGRLVRSHDFGIDHLRKLMVIGSASQDPHALLGDVDRLDPGSQTSEVD